MLKNFYIRDEEVRNNLIAFIDSTWPKMASKKCLCVELYEEGRTRSTRANARYWANTMRQVAEQAWVEDRQYDAKAWHEYFKNRFAPRLDKVGGGSYAMSTADMTDSEFAEFVVLVESCASSELGVSFLENREPVGR